MLSSVPPPSQELLQLPADTLDEVSAEFTPDGYATLVHENSPLAEAVAQVAGHMALHGTYTDARDLQAAGHPISVIKAPVPGQRGPNGNSLVYAREGGLIIKASMPGFDDADSFRDMQHLHTALADHGGRVGAPAQLALLRSNRTGQTSLIMERVPGDDLGAYTHSMAGNVPRQESKEAYEAGVREVKHALRQAIGRSAMRRLDDLAVVRHAANILTTGDPRQPETRLHVIDQRFRGAVGATLAPVRRIGRR